MARRSPTRLVVRVVHVAAAGAADARRRVADVLLRAARARAESPEPAPTPSANEPLALPGEKAA